MQAKTPGSGWIPIEDEKPRPNSRIRVKGFKRDNPEEVFVSPSVYVDEDGLFATSAEIQDTHWQYVELGRSQ